MGIVNHASPTGIAPLNHLEANFVILNRSEGSPPCVPAQVFRETQERFFSVAQNDWCELLRMMAEHDVAVEGMGVPAITDRRQAF
jgi:hypothetical protein